MKKILITYEMLNRGKQIVEDSLVVAAGMFDGIHRGHQVLLKETKNIAKRNNLKSAILSVNYKPRTDASFAGRLLMTENDKATFFCKEAIDYFIIVDLTPEMMKLTPELYIEKLMSILPINIYIAGFDYRFGHRGSGTIETLQQLETKFNYKTKVIDEIKDEKSQISSSLIKEQILKGDIEYANELLGSPYTITGKVVHGEKKGRILGFPTINMQDDQNYVLPPMGVYATTVRINNKEYIGLTNIGYSPTVKEDSPLLVETNILDFTGDLYGQELQVSFYKKIRDELRFSSIEALITQMEQDKKEIKQLLESAL